MAAHVLVVDLFGNPIGHEDDVDLLKYTTYIPGITSDINADGKVFSYELPALGKTDIKMTLFRYMDEDLRSDDLTIVFIGDVMGQKETATPVIPRVFEHIIELLSLMSCPEFVEINSNGTYVDGSGSMVIPGVGRWVADVCADNTRAVFGLVSKN